MKTYFYPHEQDKWKKEHERADHLIANKKGVIAAIYLSPEFRDESERKAMIRLLSDSIRKET